MLEVRQAGRGNQIRAINGQGVRAISRVIIGIGEDEVRSQELGESMQIWGARMIRVPSKKKDSERRVMRPNNPAPLITLQF